MEIQFKRGNSSARSNYSEKLSDGQPFFEKDTKKLYIGDGTTPLKDLKAITDSLKVEDLTATNYCSFNGIFVDNSTTNPICFKRNNSIVTKMYGPTSGGGELVNVYLPGKGGTIALASETVSSLGGKTGAITLGTGLSISNTNVLSCTATSGGSAGVTSLGGETGAIDLGEGLDITGGVLYCTVADGGGGSAGVSSIGGKTGAITLSTGLKMSGKQLVNKVKDIYTSDGYLCIDTNYTN